MKVGMKAWPSPYGRCACIMLSCMRSYGGNVYRAPASTSACEIAMYRPCRALLVLPNSAAAEDSR